MMTRKAKMALTCSNRPKSAGRNRRAIMGYVTIRKKLFITFPEKRTKECLTKDDRLREVSPANFFQATPYQFS